MHENVRKAYSWLIRLNIWIGLVDLDHLASMVDVSISQLLDLYVESPVFRRGLDVVLAGVVGKVDGSVGIARESLHSLIDIALLAFDSLLPLAADSQDMILHR